MEERTLKKLSKNEFELRTELKEAKLVTIKGYKREELRDIYKELKLRRDQAGMQKAKIEKDIKKLDVDDSRDLREFMDKMVMASKLQDLDKLTMQMDLVKKDLGTLAKQMKEISSAVPEVLRDK